MCNKCGLFERTHSRPRPEQFPHKRGPLAVSVSRRTPPGNHLPPISNQTGYQYHHTQITPLNAGEYHPNPLPGLQTWQNNGGTNATNNNGTSSQSHNGSTHGVSPTEQPNVSGNGVSGSGTGVGDSSTTMGGPLLIPRRQTLDSPRMSASASSTPRGGRPFDEPLSSNASGNTGGGGVPTSVSAAGDSSHPPTPPSRSSTAVGVKPHEGGSPTDHSPPPATITSAGSSARDQA